MAKCKALKLPIAKKWCFRHHLNTYCHWYRTSTSWDFEHCYYYCWKKLPKTELERIERGAS